MIPSDRTVHQHLLMGFNSTGDDSSCRLRVDKETLLSTFLRSRYHQGLVNGLSMMKRDAVRIKGRGSSDREWMENRRRMAET